MRFPTRYSPENRSGHQWLTKIPQGFHPGVDFNYGSGADDEGQDVVAITDRVVTHAKFCKGRGNHVVIYHQKHKVWSHYAHLKSLHVEKGEEVKEGQLVGPLGGTGGDWLPHLHFEIRLIERVNFDKYVTGMSKKDVEKNYTDPEKWMNKKIQQEERQNINQQDNMITYKEIGKAPIYMLVGNILIPFATSFEDYEKEFKNAKVVMLSESEFKKFKVSKTVKIISIT